MSCRDDCSFKKTKCVNILNGNLEVLQIIPNFAMSKARVINVLMQTILLYGYICGNSIGDMRY